MRAWLAVIAAALACLAVPAALPAFWVTLLGYVGLAAIVAIGLVLLTGISGQTSFGQASFVGIAAYATAILTTFQHQSPLVGLAVGLALTGATAWLLGLITSRLSGHFLALCSVAWGIGFYVLFGTLPWLHGFNGFGNIPPLSIGPLSLADRRVNLGLIWLAVVLVALLTRNLLGSRSGRAIRALNGAQLMADSMGVNIAGLSRTVFVVAALYAGLSGWLFVHFQRFVNPTPFSLTASIEYLFMAIVGGSEWVGGAVLGAALITLLRDQLNDWVPWLIGQPGNYESVVFALVVIVLLHRAPAGLWPVLRRTLTSPALAGESLPPGSDPGVERRSRSGEGAASPEQPSPGALRAPTSQAERERCSNGIPVLSVESLSRIFGGLTANKDVTLHVNAAEIVALIGPNGAGKSTLFNVINGMLAPTSGSIHLFGRKLRHVPPRQIAALGVARTFQHVKLLPGASVADNVALGAHRRGRAGVLRSMLRLDRREEARLIALAHNSARRVGLGHVLRVPAGNLPLGQQRIVELARALCLGPRLLLLDEPAAGLRHQEKQRLAALLRQLRDEGLAVLLVEHDMDFVMRLADRVVVMDFGQIIAEGLPERVQTDPIVLEAYLGSVA